MIRGKWWNLSILLVAFASCSPHITPVVVNKSPNSGALGHQAEHVVKSGETLYSIAWSIGIDYQTLASWNGIAAPYTIYPGQRIKLSQSQSDQGGLNATRSGAQAKQSQTSVTSGGASPNAQSASKPQSKPKPKTEPKTVPPKDRIASWHWPAKGELIAKYSPSAGVNGIRIAAPKGAPIQAAADGTVVYVGDGLRGYGKLVLIKHNDSYLSAYAHNDAILVTEGQKMKKGESIARMGSSGSDRVMLHFEIREHGKPIDPLAYLK